jgi:two-component system sensor histidine kinase YesM
MRKSIKKRLLKSFVLLVALPVLAIFFLINTIYWLNIRQTAAAQGEAIVDEIESDLVEQFARYEALVTFIERDEDFRLAARYPEPNLDPDEHQRLTDVLENYASSVSSVDRIALLYVNGSFYCTEETLPSPVSFKDQSCYNECLDQPDQIRYFNYAAGENPMLAGTPQYTSSLSICKALQDQRGDIFAVANITVRGEAIGQLLSNLYSQQGGQTYLATPDGTLVNSPLQLENLIGHNDRRYLQIRRPVGNLPLTILSILPIRQLQNQQVLFAVLGLMVGILFALLFYHYSRSMLNDFVRPIEVLRQQMKQVQAGNLTSDLRLDAADEFNELAESYNAMVDEIGRLIDQVYAEQASKRRAEMAALQAHIKPHFLFNTFDTIHWMARRYGADDIVKAVDALSDLFRAGFSSQQTYCTVLSELQHTESYLKIQKLRYDEVLNYQINLDPALAKLIVQKMILQPLVENALYHGLKENNQPGLITIDTWLDGADLLIEVQDNGYGISEDELARVRQILEASDLTQLPAKTNSRPGNGTGLFNVQQRLRLSFGPGYGLTVDSQPGKGTRVLVRHPALYQMPADFDERTDRKVDA